jgi:hypothetical protein
MKKWWITVIVIILVSFGCATQRTTQPRISASPRTNISLETPILVSVLDARSVATKSNDSASILEKDLKSIYGDSIKIFDYFDKVPDDRVALRIRLMANEANFGSRIISASSIEQSYSTAQAEASSAWSSVIATASKTQTTLGSSFLAEGWWIGTSWIELQVIDQRQKKNEFKIPIVAEKKRSNTFGYSTANKVVDETWSDVEQQLLQVIDKVILSIRARQN